MDQMPSSSMPPSHSDMPVSHTESHSESHTETKSLVKPQMVRAKRPVFLWLIVLLLLGGTGFMGYMMYNQQNTLDAFQISFTQWTEQVNSIQRNYDSSFKSLGDKLATVETSALAIQQDLDLMKTARTAEPMPTEEPGMMTETGSMMNGAITEEDAETAYYEANLVLAEQGEMRVEQPDGIALVKSRQMSADGNLHYDVFRSKANPDQIYMYVRKAEGATSEFIDGWFGPFTMPAV